MAISATLKNASSENDITVSTDVSNKKINILVKTIGKGSSVNGGELLALALATCFCNDIYREAARRNIHIASVEVTATGEFGTEGEPASSISYEVQIQAPGCSMIELDTLINDVDSIAEIHNTLRKGMLYL